MTKINIKDNTHIHLKDNYNINMNKNDNILPMFITPVIKKLIIEKEKNIYNYNTLNIKEIYSDHSDYSEHSESNIIIKQTLSDIFLKGLISYNNSLNTFVSKEINHRLKLILKLKNDDIYEYNLYLSKLLYTINRFFPIFKIRSLLKKINLFVPTKILKPNPNIRFNYKLRYIAKIYIFPEITTLFQDVPTNTNFIIDKSNNTNLIKYDPTNTELNEEDEEDEPNPIFINVYWKMLFDIINLVKICKKEIINLNYFINRKKIIIQHMKNSNMLNNNVLPLTLNNKINNFNLLNKNINNKYTVSSLIRNQINSVIKTKMTDNNLNINNKSKITNSSVTIFKDKNINSTFDFKNVSLISIINSNKIKIIQTINSIKKNNKFNNKTDSIYLYSNPVKILYNYPLILPKNPLNNRPIISQYIKEMSDYNMNRKGIFINYSNIIGFNFNYQTNKLIKHIYKLLDASFKSMFCLISKPVFVITPDKIIIQLFYYILIPNLLKYKRIYQKGYRLRYRFRNRHKLIKLYAKYKSIKRKFRIKLRKLAKINLNYIYPNKFKNLCDILSKLFNKSVEFNLIRIHYPYNDSNILANFLGLMVKRKKVRIIMKKLYRRAIIKNINKINNNNKINVIPAFLSGLTVKIAGRLMTHKLIPRQTVKITRRGTSAPGKINFYDVARITKKNKRGAFSITVSAGQNFFNT
jgi:hypothetical protein